MSVDDPGVTELTQRDLLMDMREDIEGVNAIVDAIARATRSAWSGQAAGVKARVPANRGPACATDREVGVVAAVLAAGSEKATAHRPSVSYSTVKHHLESARPKWARRRPRSSCGSWPRGCRSPTTPPDRPSEARVTMR
jgi:hypothetical protein